MEVSGAMLHENFKDVVAVNRTFVDVTAINDTDLIPAQSGGKAIRVLALYIRSALAVTVRLKSAGNNISAGLSLGANDESVHPYNPHGWYQTNPDEKLVLNQGLAVATGVQIVWIVV